MKNKHYQIYARDGNRYDYCEDEERDYYLTYHKDDDVLVVTTNTGTPNPPIIEVARFFRPTRYVIELIEE